MALSISNPDNGTQDSHPAPGVTFCLAQETFGAMDKREKVFFILEQVRLCLDRKDFIRAQILIRKVSPRAFAERADKKGQSAGEVGIEGTTIEAADEVGACTIYVYSSIGVHCRLTSFCFGKLAVEGLRLRCSICLYFGSRPHQKSTRTCAEKLRFGRHY